MTNWQPSASIENLIKRSLILRRIRQFFYDRNFLEVETPSMSCSSVTDVGLVPFRLNFNFSGDRENKIPFYLITSPEFHMKRLLAAGCGPIFQLSKSFRNEEFGRYHNPEFTMLEWYRPGYNMYDLMNESNDLLQCILQYDSLVEFISYRELFIDRIGIDPLSIDKDTLYNFLLKFSFSSAISLNDSFDIMLQLLFVMLIEPDLGKCFPVFVYHFPASQAGLSRVNVKDVRVAERFEIYYKGIELANGFCELVNVNEQRKRFIKDNEMRVMMGLPVQVIDERLLSAMNYGIPECSGIALGIDRLVMLSLKANNLSEVMAFSLDRA